MTSASSVTALKKAFRKDFAKKLKALPASIVSEESAAITSYVIASPWYERAKNISVYVSLPHSEVQTDAIIHHAFANGKRVFIPFCPIAEPTVMKMLRVRQQDFVKLKENRWGIRELDPVDIEGLEDAEDAASGGLDLILEPGLAFDRKGHRLGHGRGYYDRFVTSLADYPTRFNKSAPFTAALALRAQVLPSGEEVPTADHDRNPDAIVTADGPLLPSINVD